MILYLYSIYDNFLEYYKMYYLGSISDSILKFHYDNIK